MSSYFNNLVLFLKWYSNLGLHFTFFKQVKKQVKKTALHFVWDCEVCTNISVKVTDIHKNHLKNNFSQFQQGLSFLDFLNNRIQCTKSTNYKGTGNIIQTPIISCKHSFLVQMAIQKQPSTSTCKTIPSNSKLLTCINTSGRKATGMKDFFLLT